MKRPNKDLQAAMEAHRTGDLNRAEKLYLAAIKKNPANTQALLYFGSLLCQRNDYARAITYFEQAQGMGQEDEMLHINLGLCLQNLDRHSQAVEHFQKAAQKAPDLPDIYFNLGLSQLKLENFSEAEAALKKALSLNPQDAEAYSNLVTSLIKQNKIPEAIEVFEKAETLPDCSVNLYCRMGEAYSKNRDFHNAAAAYAKALELVPDKNEALLGHAHMQAQAGFLPEARKSIEKLLNKNPEDEAALTVAAAIQLLSGNISTGKDYAAKAVDLNDRNGDAWGLLGYALMKKAKHGEAERCFLKAIEYCPNDSTHYLNRGTNLISLGRVPEAVDCARTCLEMSPREHGAFSNVLLYLHYSDAVSPEEIFNLHKQWAGMYAPDENKTQRPHRTSKGKIHIGFVSGDLHTHSVSYFLEPLLLNLPELGCKAFLYSNTINSDKRTQRLINACEGNWRDIRHLNDQQAAELISQDQIDILIDLSGHTDNNRLLLFSLHPAPVQATWLGYPDTTGLNQIQWRIVDSITDPEGAEGYATENLCRLEPPFVCYQPPEDAPPISALSTENLKFGCFNNLAKISDTTVSIWSQILRQSPNSTMLIKARGLEDRDARENLANRFLQAGIPAERLEMIGMLPERSQHLQLYSQVSVALDTFPYNGTTTTCEALWMGCPVISLCGQNHASRVGASLLSSCSLQDLICLTPDEYIGKAVQLIQEHGLLNDLRQNMRQRLISRPLLDGKDFTRRFTNAITEIIRNTANI